MLTEKHLQELVNDRRVDYRAEAIANANAELNAVGLRTVTELRQINADLLDALQAIVAATVDGGAINKIARAAITKVA